MMENTGLETAPDEIKLAIDLIYLLENQNIDPMIVIMALDIVKRDFEQKISKNSASNKMQDT